MFILDLAAAQPDIGTALSAQADKKKSWTSMSAAFVSAGIPLYVFRNPSVRNWLKTNLKFGDNLPSESTLRTYLKEEGIQDTVNTTMVCKDKDILVMVDETQDFKNRKILNVLVAPAEIGRKFRLAYTEILVKCNAEVVIQKILIAIQKIGVTIDRVVMLISDNAKYMLLAGKLLTGLNSRCIHSTCWAHVLHLVSDEIRLGMKETDRFISQVKASLVKASSRRQELINTLEENHCDAKLPPTPVLTRWTTWLAAGSYHFKNFVALKQWIQLTDPDSVAVRELKDLIEDSDLYHHLSLINDVYPGLSQAIKTLEGMSLPACDVYTILASVRDLIDTKLGSGSLKLEKYWNGKNQHPAIDFWRSVQMLDPFKYRINPVNELPKYLLNFSDVRVPPLEFARFRVLCSQIGDAADITPISFWNTNKREMPVLYKLASAALSVPPSSAEVERSFSTLKRLMRPERGRLTEENLGLHLRIMFNARLEPGGEDNSESEGQSDED